jgi:hypothetical protein
VPRYFFHIQDGASLPDETGTELADIEDAKVAAVQLAAGILKDIPMGAIWNGTPWRLEVSDSPKPDGRTLLVLHISATEE